LISFLSSSVSASKTPSALGKEAFKVFLVLEDVLLLEGLDLEEGQDGDPSDRGFARERD